jgi:cytochrome c-type biogenesis protein CcmH
MLERALIAAGLALACAAVPAQQAAPRAADPALEAQVLRIADELRCLVCQNETIAASNADLAVDLRQQIRSQLQQGRSEAQIRDFMVQRYGEFVLYRPPVKGSTWALWAGPFVLLLAAAGALVATIRRRRREAAAPPPLDAAERERLRQLLGDGSGPA